MQFVFGLAFCDVYRNTVFEFEEDITLDSANINIFTAITVAVTNAFSTLEFLQARRHRKSFAGHSFLSERDIVSRMFVADSIMRFKSVKDFFTQLER